MRTLCNAIIFHTGCSAPYTAVKHNKRQEGKKQFPKSTHAARFSLLARVRVSSCSAIYRIRKFRLEFPDTKPVSLWRQTTARLFRFNILRRWRQRYFSFKVLFLSFIVLCLFNAFGQKPPYEFGERAKYIRVRYFTKYSTFYASER